jgi:hypothetical protein
MKQKQHGKELGDDQVTVEAQEWIRTVRRILVSAKDHGHGASFLFLKSRIGRDLKPRHSIEYSHLEAAMTARALARIRQSVPDTELDRLLEIEMDEVPADLYLDHSIASSDAEDAEEAINGAIEFIATLSRIDGATNTRGSRSGNRCAANIRPLRPSYVTAGKDRCIFSFARLTDRRRMRSRVGCRVSIRIPRPSSFIAAIGVSDSCATCQARSMRTLFHSIPTCTFTRMLGRRSRRTCTPAT